MGPAGISAVQALPLQPGSACATGGLLLTDADGGSTVLCNGTKGDTGAQGVQGTPGMNGAAGPQGPMGASPKTLTVRDQDGGILGSVYSTGSDTVNYVYLESVECVSQVNWQNNTITGLQATIYYTGPSCTGTAMTRVGSFFPVGCMLVGETAGFKVRQPVYTQTFTTVSSFQLGIPLADGGVTTRCLPTPNEMSNGAVVDSINLQTINGPFILGNR